MTWRKLAKMIADLPEDKKDEDVIRFDCCEGRFYRLSCLSIVEDDEGQKPEGTPYLEA